MANTKPKVLTVALHIALSPADRKRIERAAKILESPPSVWARSVLLRDANQVISESKAAANN